MQQWIKEVARGKRGAKDLSYEQAKLAAETLFQKKRLMCKLPHFLLPNGSKRKRLTNCLLLRKQ